jgi:polyferredoxin
VLRHVRRAVQAASLLLFLVLLVMTRYGGTDDLAWPVRLYLDIDPLVMVGTLLSAHTVPVAFLSALVVLLLGLVLGRSFCGWLCPLGALNQIAGHLQRRRPGKERAVRRWSGAQRIKFGVLAAVLVASAFGLQWVGVVDPISLTIRSLSLAVGPAIELVARQFFDAAYHTGLDPVRAVSEPVYGVAKDHVLSFEQPSFRQAPLLGALFLAILALNLYRPRFWCRYLCPLGGLLGLPARFGALRLGLAAEACDGCGKCTARCPAGAEPEAAAEGSWRPAECYVCGNCTSTCDKGLGFGFGRPDVKAQRVAGVDAGRRTVIVGVAVGFAAAPLLRVPGARALASPVLIRPPGSVPESDFLLRCVRCGECMKVCLTGGLQPTGLEAGLEGIWTPVLVPRRGYCEYNCTLCGQVCPTGAIEELTVEEKQEVHIGTAFVDPERCLPIALGTECVVCEEHCPTPTKAIQLVEIEALGPDGTPQRARRPVVDPNVCIGCGICETRCPVMDLPAIRITSIGETRDEDNQLLLDPGGGGMYGY